MPNSTAHTAARVPLLPALAACVVLAAASLAAPLGPLYDPWAWFVWGRELAGFELDTSAGPSWKPLPVLVAVPASVAGGDAAPALWLVIARAAWLALPVLAWRVGVRLAGDGGAAPVLAGLAAALGVLLIQDDVTAWSRQAGGGLSEPLLAALVLGAVDAGLAGRPRIAIGLALAACLLRPEAWPFAAAYAWWAGRRPLAIAAGAGAVAALWFVPDLLATGDALAGAERARGADNGPLDVLGWALEMPLAALWIGVAVVAVRGGPHPAARPLAAGAGAWIALVALMAAAGFAGLPRFMAPAIAVLSTVGAAGLAGARAPRLAGGMAVAVALVLLVQAGVRAERVPGEIERLADETRSIDRLRDLAAARSDAFTGCGELWTSDFLTHTAVAWELDVALGDVTTTRLVAPPEGRLVVGPRTSPALAARAARDGPPVAAAEEWRVYGTGACARVSGVSGARR